MKKIFYVLFLIVFLTNIFLPAFAFTTEDEINVGRQAAAQIEQEYRILTDDQYQGRVNYVGKLLYNVAPRKELPYTFKVIDTNVFNAMSLPGGFIYVTRELMDKTNDGELAFVLGHEMAHSAHSHQLKQAEKEMSTSLGILALALILTRGNISQGAMNTAALANTVLTSSYSRADEQQADIDALSYMGGAGYDPNYAVSAFEKMKTYGSGMPGFLNTIVGDHPLPDERIRYVKDKIPEINFKPKSTDPFPPYGESTAGKGYNDGNRIDTSGAAPQESIAQESKIYENADTIFLNYKQITYGNLTESDFRKYVILYNWENKFFDFLKTKGDLKGALIRDRQLDNKARTLALKKTYREITPDYVIYADIISENMGYYDYEESFYVNDLNKIQALGKVFTRAGISIKLLPDYKKYIIIVFKYE